MRRRLNILFLQTAMADTATPPVIRRADYAPPAFLIDTVALEFDLVPERTVVKNTMRLHRNPDAAPAAHLELIGERLEFVSAAIAVRTVRVQRQLLHAVRGGRLSGASPISSTGPT
jgi:aminopeptidase N